MQLNSHHSLVSSLKEKQAYKADSKPTYITDVLWTIVLPHTISKFFLTETGGVGPLLIIYIKI
jgi:hypothetical protein